jgi:hypothetical protein
MSMTCWMVRLSPTQITSLRATPSLASDLVLVAREDQLQSHLPSSEQEAFKALLTEAGARLKMLGTIEQAFALDTSWHILHYLLSGKVDVSDSLPAHY